MPHNVRIGPADVDEQLKTLGEECERVAPLVRLTYTHFNGRGATCNHDKKTVTTTLAKCLCWRLQELIQELTNLSYASVRSQLEAEAKKGNVSRDHFIKAVEHMEFQGVRNVVLAYDNFKPLFGCDPQTDKNSDARTYVYHTSDIWDLSIDDKVFTKYFNAIPTDAHKANIGAIYDSLMSSVSATAATAGPAPAAEASTVPVTEAFGKKRKNKDKHKAKPKNKHKRQKTKR